MAESLLGCGVCFGNPISVKMSDKLSHLQCHFIWKPLDGIADFPLKSKVNLDPESRIDFLKMDIKMNPEIEVPALTLIAYLYTQLQNPNLTEATNFADKALNKGRTFRSPTPEQARGYEIVSLSLKAHVLHLRGNNEKEVDNILCELEKCNPISNKAQAFIHGTHAYACSMLGPAKYKKGLKLSIQAVKLDPNWYAWPMSIASLAGRIRRFVEGSKSYPTSMEEENMEKAVALSGGQQPLPVVFLADLYFTKGRFNGCMLSFDTDLLKKAEKLYRLAYRLGPNTIYVLSRCGKAFAQLKYDDLAEECFKKSLKLQPEDCVSLRGLGQLYEFSENRRDLQLALEYYVEANKHWQNDNVHSDLNLCRIQRKLDPNFNDLEEYSRLSKKYSDDQRALTFIQDAAKKQEDYYHMRNDNRTHYINEGRGRSNFRRGGVRNRGSGYNNRGRNVEQGNHSNQGRNNDTEYNDRSRSYEQENNSNQGRNNSIRGRHNGNRGRNYEQRNESNPERNYNQDESRSLGRGNNSNQQFRGPSRAHSSAHRTHFNQHPPRGRSNSRLQHRLPGPPAARSPALGRTYPNTENHQKSNESLAEKSPVPSRNYPLSTDKANE